MERGLWLWEGGEGGDTCILMIGDMGNRGRCFVPHQARQHRGAASKPVLDVVSRGLSVNQK